MMTGYYLTVLKSNPNYESILLDCELEHKKNAPGCLLSVAPLKDDEVLIKIAKGSDIWLSKSDWKNTILQKFKSDEANARLDYFNLKKPVDEKPIEVKDGT